MKLKLFSIPCILFLAVILIIAFLYKKKGLQEQQGQQARQDQQGTAGPTEPMEPWSPGATGTANVIYSDWTDTTTWKADTVMNGTVIDTLGFFANINAPKLDLTMLNTGEMKVYVNANTTADPVVFPIPFNNGNIFY